MNTFTIAIKNILQRIFASCMTTISMALGVTLIVIILTTFGSVTKFLEKNSSFGYDMIVGARGGKLQLTLNSVYYLSQPVETIPYEYLLEFADGEKREEEFKNSFAYRAHEATWNNTEMTSIAGGLGAMGGPADFFSPLLMSALKDEQLSAMQIDRPGMFASNTDIAIPICLGDFFGDFRVIATNTDFFGELYVDPDKDEKFRLAEGRFFQHHSEENGFFECVLGSIVASQKNVKVGDKINPIHGVPESEGSGVTHAEGFTVVGILESTTTPNDRAVFINMEGFYLMDNHTKPLGEKIEIIGSSSSMPGANGQMPGFEEAAMLKDDFDDIDWETGDVKEDPNKAPNDEKKKDDSEGSPTEEKSLEKENADQDPAVDCELAQSPINGDNNRAPASYAKLLTLAGGDTMKPPVSKVSFAFDDPPEGWEPDYSVDRDPVAMEQREITAILIRSKGLLGSIPIETPVNEGILENSLNWSPYRPFNAQKSAQAVLPIREIAILTNMIVKPIQLAMLGLTLLICVVSGISILVSIYNSMSERRHEIAIMRALGANRSQILTIILVESMIIAVAGGMLGWFGGHLINALCSPFLEAYTGVRLSFWEFAPPLVIAWEPLSFLAMFSPELLLIPGLILLAVLVGIIPAISAYRTDVSKSLGV